MVEAWTRAAIRLRWPIVVVWLAVVLAGGWASGRLSALQSNVFSVPGTSSEHVRNVLQQHFGDRSDGEFTVVFRVADSGDAALEARLQRAVDPCRRGPADRERRPRSRSPARTSSTETWSRPSTSPQAKGHADDLVRALGQPAGAQRVCHRRAGDPVRPRPDLQPGPPEGRVDRAADRAARPPARLRALVGGDDPVPVRRQHGLRDARHRLRGRPLHDDADLRDESRLPDRSRDRDRLLAADRLPLPRGARSAGSTVEAAVVRTMQTAGRAVIFSGATVAIGLALLLLMPLPFMRAIGVGGFLLPVVSIAAAATLQPALLSIYGRRGTRRRGGGRRLRSGCASGPRRRTGDVEHRLLGAPRPLDHAPQWRYVTVDRRAPASRLRSRSPGSSSRRARPRASRSPRSRSAA